jgi:hypothetical protein
MGGLSERKIPLGIPKCRKENNIKMDLKKQGVRLWTDLIWISSRLL